MINLKFTLEEGSVTRHVFTLLADEDGHVDVQAEDEESFLAALDKVEEMISFIRSQFEVVE